MQQLPAVYARKRAEADAASSTTTAKPAGEAKEGGEHEQHWTKLVDFVKKTPGMGARLVNLFVELDADGSGDVDTSEFVLGIRGLGADLTDDELKRLYTDCDANGDGVVRGWRGACAQASRIARPPALTTHTRLRSRLTHARTRNSRTPPTRTQLTHDEFTDELMKHFPKMPPLTKAQRREAEKVKERNRKQKLEQSKLVASSATHVDPRFVCSAH